jgi:catechol 2,3-dioxygenase-like lactoylglutathione lyase family enzyme
MIIRRVVPMVQSDKFDECRRFYSEFLGLRLAMDLGTVISFASPDNPTAQIGFMKPPDGASGCGPIDPRVTVSIEVENVVEMHARAKAKGVEIVYPLAVEPWGVTRFFARDPNGMVLNIMSHTAEKK